jgi:hypothetical protein
LKNLPLPRRITLSLAGIVSREASPMDDMDNKRDDIVGTTDYLEAITVFKAAKNVLFAVMLLSLLAMILCFFGANSGYTVFESRAVSESAAPAVPLARNIEKLAVHAAATVGAVDPNIPESLAMTPPAPQSEREAGPPAPGGRAITFRIRFDWIAWLLRVSGFAAVTAAVLYALVLVFCLKVSLVGRLGGINHIARAFVLSLVVLVLLLPWQKYFGGVLAGAVFTPEELLKACTAAAPRDLFEKAFFYARFAGFPAVVILLMFASHVRTVRWAKATLRRLGVM